MSRNPALKGHDVTAFARSRAGQASSAGNVSTITGEVTDPDRVQEAIQDHDAVLCALGAPLSSRAQVRAQGTENIASGMQKAGVTRLICVSALGVGESRDLLPWHYRFVIIPLFMRRLYNDHTLQEHHITESGLDWTIVRPGVLSDGPRTGRYRIGFTREDRPSAPKVSRADVADFMVKELTANAHVHQRRCIAY